jgi:DNA-binding transcriptional MerR regulator
MMTQAANIYLIKDLSRLSGQSIHTIKFYLKLGLIREAGRSPETRFRYFDDSTIEALAAVRAFQKEGKSLSQIAALVPSAPNPPGPTRSGAGEPPAVSI